MHVYTYKYIIYIFTYHTDQENFSDTHFASLDVGGISQSILFRVWHYAKFFLDCDDCGSDGIILVKLVRDLTRPGPPKGS